MALTKEILRANKILDGLTDEQYTAISVLSQNDEAQIIGARFSEVYRQMDETISATLGVERNGDEKTYKYLERAGRIVREKADKVEGLTKDIAALTKERDKLAQSIAEGSGDAETKKQLDQARKDLNAMVKQFNDLNAEYTQAKETHTRELMDVRIGYELDAATRGLKVKGDLPKAVVDIVLSQAVAKVKGMSPEYMEKDGAQILVFKDESGAVRRNASNLSNPYTAQELLAQELKAMGVLDEGRQAGGGGTTGGGGTSAGARSIDIAGAKTRAEAMEIIHASLTAEGLTRTNPEYQTRLDKAWVDNNISALPEQ